VTFPVSVEGERELPATFALRQNYPNPFNPATTIEFSTGSRRHAVLTVYDLLGREVVTLVNGDLPPGTHAVQFDGRGCASGVYLYRLTAGDVVLMRRMVLLK